MTTTAVNRFTFLPSETGLVHRRDNARHCPPFYPHPQNGPRRRPTLHAAEPFLLISSLTSIAAPRLHGAQTATGHYRSLFAPQHPAAWGTGTEARRAENAAEQHPELYGHTETHYQGSFACDVQCRRWFSQQPYSRMAPLVAWGQYHDFL